MLYYCIAINTYIQHGKFITIMSLVEIVEGQVQTSIRLPKELLKRAKKYAIDNDTSLAALLIESLESYLNKKEK